MPAADPKKILTLADITEKIKRKADNVRINLETGNFEVLDKENKVVKTIVVEKGIDAVYLTNITESPDDLKKASEFLLNQRNKLAKNAAEYETLVAEKQDELLKAVAIWEESSPGASRRDLSIQIGRLQNMLAVLEHKLRNSQYKYRDAVSVNGLKRRTYVPHSFDDRVVPHSVYRLNATQTNSKLRVMPVE